MQLFACIVILHLSLLYTTAWDIAVVTREVIEFFRNSTSIGVGRGFLKELTVAAYDPLHGYLYVSDSVHPNTSIFRINLKNLRDRDLTTLIFEPVASKQSSVQGMTYDPVSSTLLWTTGSGNTILSLVWSEMNVSRVMEQHPGTVLHRFDDGSVPRGIAVDSCTGTVYWTNIKPLAATIEKSQLDGSNRTIIVSSQTSNVKLFQPYGLVVDYEIRKLFWCDAITGNSYQIVHSDLDGSNAVVVLSHSGYEPYGLSIASNMLYWTDHFQGNLFSMPKNGLNQSQPTIVKQYSRIEKPDGVVSNALYENVNTELCSPLASLLPQIRQLANRESDSSEEIVQTAMNCSDKQIQCLNGGALVNDVCQCPEGFVGMRCEQWTCHNYCVTGSCHLDENGRQRCECEVGWSGDRCEESRCSNACLNSGQCLLDDKGEAICKCAFGYEGRHCEFKSNSIKTLCDVYCKMDQYYDRSRRFNQLLAQEFGNAIEILSQSSLHVCNCLEMETSLLNDADELRNEDDQNENDTFSGSKNILLITLLVAGCVLLGGLVLLLTSKLLRARGRPRIQKRIIVNRKAPLPEQCEITIENCCNMNVCETPCFEPLFLSSRPTFIKKKKKSEDKKALVTSMYLNGSSQGEDN